MREADFELIDRFLRGDGTAFDELVQRRQREVYNLAYRMARNAEDARDVSQEAYRRKPTSTAWLAGVGSWFCLPAPPHRRLGGGGRFNHVRG